MKLPVRQVTLQQLCALTDGGGSSVTADAPILSCVLLAWRQGPCCLQKSKWVPCFVTAPLSCYSLRFGMPIL
jgi:hypothetical protein